MENLFIVILACVLCLLCALNIPRPPLRKFLRILPDTQSTDTTADITSSSLRVLQFNILADGLSGLRDDLGAFSRALPQWMGWETRKVQLLHEILQYNPDVVTLQECDHFYDFFLSKLSTFGYDGVYAPKPASACLEVHENSDGCAIFVKRDKVRIVSTETLTFALSKADVDPSNTNEIFIGGVGAAKSPTKSGQIRAQNQVGLIVTCEFLGINDVNCPLVISTTHLKAAKNEIGELYRLNEVNQLLQSVDRTVALLKEHEQDPAVILTGDLNAAPDDKTTGYDAKAYESVKAHRLGLRSVLNDDLKEFLQVPSEEIWTTWKARRKKGQEKIAKSCIDYIMYMADDPTASPVSHAKEKTEGPTVFPKSILELFADDEVPYQLFPNKEYPSDHIAIACDFIIQEPREPPKPKS